MKRLKFWPRITESKRARDSFEAYGGVWTTVRRAFTLTPRLLLPWAFALAACSEAPAPTPTVSSPQTAARVSNNTLSHQYVGSQVCGECHQQALSQWQNSHHAWAMREPSAKTVKADFSAPPLTINDRTLSFSQADGYRIRLDDAQGQIKDFRVAYTFGISPLQQYLTDMGQGRLQALPVVWDTRSNSEGWYHLQPDSVGKGEDVLHWTSGGQNWNHMCADCHSTRVNKAFDAQSDSYQTHFAEVSVGCEACHGPGKSHSEAPHQFAVVALDNPQIRQDVCASCHSRRSQVAENFVAGSRLLDHYEPSLLDQGLYFADGQILDEVFVYGSFAQSKMHAAGVSCGDCHAPHSGELLRSGNEVCTACHSPTGYSRYPGLRSKVYDSPEHHFHGAAEARGQTQPAGSGTACVDCHMTARTYMGIDQRRDHSFRIPRPDLSVDFDVPNACGNCHQDYGDEWAVKQITAHTGREPDPHFVSAFAPAREGKRRAHAGIRKLLKTDGQPGIVRATALSLLGQYDAGAPELRLGLTDPDPLVRLGALRGVAASAAGQWRVLIPSLEDPLRVIRFAAVTALLPAYQQLGGEARAKMDVATDEYLAYLGANTDRAEALTSRALVRVAKGDVSSAERDLKLALQRNSAWIPGLVNLADVYRVSGRDLQAGELLARALELAPEASQVRVARALWLVRQGNLAGAIDVLGEGYKARQEPASGYVYAVALNSAGQSSKALQVIDDLLASDLHTPQLLQLGMSLANKGRWPQRMARYQAAYQVL